MKKIHICQIGPFLLAFILFLIGSCNIDKKNDIVKNEYTSFRVDVDHKNDSCNSFIKYAEFTALEFNNQAILNGIDKLILSKENLIVFDKRQKQVIVFDKSGNYYSKIRKFGKGPNEYTFPTDIIFDENENKIGIVAQLKGCIIWFNLDGDFLSSSYISREKLILSQAFIWENKIYHFVHNSKTGKNPYQINVTNRDLKKINYSMIGSNLNQISNLHMHPFCIYKNNLTLHLPNDQYVFEILNDKASKLFYFDFMDKNLPENLLAKILSLENNATTGLIQSYNKEILDFVIVKEIIPLKDFIFLEITYKYQRFCALVKIEDNSSYVFRNNLGKFSFGKFIGCNPDENTVYFEIPPTQINKYKSSKITNIEIVRKKYSQNLLKNNPWILKVQF